MPEDDFTQTLPEKPAETSPAHESTTPATNPAATSVAEKIRGVGEKLAGKYGLKIGRGRPRKDGLPKSSDVVLQPSASPALPAVPVAAPVADSVHSELFRRSVVSAFRGVLSFAKSLIRSKAAAAGMEKDFTAKALAECEPEEAVLNDFSESLETVLKKYNVKTDYAPEIALAVSVGRLATPYAMLLKTFNEEIARKKKLENAGGAK